MPEAAASLSLRDSDAVRAAGRFAAIGAVALAVFALVLLAAGKDPLSAYAQTFRYTLASAYGFSELLVRMTPLLLAAVAVAFPSRPVDAEPLPREPSRTRHLSTPRATAGPPGSRAWRSPCVPRFSDRAGSHDDSR